MHVDYDTFLKLLVAQMKNQDPTDPMDPTEQVAQLATFSQVEQTIQTNKNLERLLTSSALSQADAVIGRTLTTADGSISGTVEEVRLNTSGITAILDSGEEVDVTAGVTIE
jgi:flagellar basal-body rod modification protein FlgD